MSSSRGRPSVVSLLASVLAIAILGLTASPAEAGFLVRVVPDQASITPGGASLQVAVELVGVGEPSQLVAYDVRLDIMRGETIDPNVRFTGVSPGANPLFGSNDFFTFNIFDPVSQESVSAAPSAAISDFSSGDPISLTDGEVFTLGFFTIEATGSAAAGVVDIKLNEGFTFIFDVVENEFVTRDRDLIDGGFTVTSESAIPAPPAAILFGIGVIGLAVVGRRSIRRPVAAR